jgi:signal transduction histidine kinase
MSSQMEIDQVANPAVNKWLINRSARGAIALSFVLGYLLGVMDTDHLTLLPFLVFTGLNVCYGALLGWLYLKEQMAQWQLMLLMLAFALLALLIGLCVRVGVGFDWLLYFVTVGLYFTYLPMRTATIFSIGLYILMGISLFAVNDWRGVFMSWLSLLAGFGFVGAFSLSNRLLTAERQRSQRLLQQLEASNSQLAIAHEQLQTYASAVEELAVDRERTRLAREIHDTLGHYLAIIRIQLETIGKLQERDPAAALAEVEEAKQVAAQCMQEVRNAVKALRPSNIARLNLIDAMTQLGHEFTSPTTELTLDLEAALPPLSAELLLAFYRVAQEALTNVRKHSQATKVLVRLRYENEILELLVRDNGVGSVKKSQQTGGFGLIGLRERIELLGGKVSYGPMEPSGYRVMASIQVSRAHISDVEEVEQEEVV